MIKINGIHHIAVTAADIKKHIEFFSDVLGCKLSAIFDMHGVPGALHAFMHMSDNSYFSIVQMPSIEDIPIELGKTHAGNAAGAAAPGAMQHLAFNVDSEEDLLAMRDRIRVKGVNVIGPIHHGVCKSIYFAGPDQMTLEVATSEGEIDQAQWIDPAVLTKTGISADEAERYKNPDSYAGEGGAVAQPAYDPSKPHQSYPEEIYQALLATPDDALTVSASYVDPPVKLD